MDPLNEVRGRAVSGLFDTPNKFPWIMPDRLKENNHKKYLQYILRRPSFPGSNLGWGVVLAVRAHERLVTPKVAMEMECIERPLIGPAPLTI
jgi:hypothetical protein